ncbi:prepilin-type N-terminal cleavage/methylation domain-containing protein [Thermosulfurimonas dismutans]|uniref:prepilin-type N-terminal cleavage/methylation domain-containing protein n=1 Tax=Thermosulfurimonas dismutans TaxID=999894 RepID=UPI0013798AA5|nr:prepilin-type N-terminal cleavage/methylation domain-containing protein [Thermosulfurimonas dismutans]
MNSGKGYSLIEILVSILIMLIILLGLLHGMSIYVTHNIKNLLRNEAVKIAQGCAQSLRNGRNCSSTVTRNIRNFSVDFRVNAPDFSSLSPGLNEVAITVEYPYKGQIHNYTLTTIIKK